MSCQNTYKLASVPDYWLSLSYHYIIISFNKQAFAQLLLEFVPYIKNRVKKDFVKSILSLIMKIPCKNIEKWTNTELYVFETEAKMQTEIWPSLCIFNMIIQWQLWNNVGFYWKLLIFSKVNVTLLRAKLCAHAYMWL